MKDLIQQIHQNNSTVDAMHFHSTFTHN